MIAARSSLRPWCRVFSHSRANSTSHAPTLASIVHAQTPSNVALIAPRQNIEWTYGDLSKRVGNLAGQLSGLGYSSGDVIATDLASCAENLVLQLAASHLGASVLTLKGPEAWEKLGGKLQVRGAVAESGSSFLMAQSFDAKHVSVEPADGKISLSELYDQETKYPQLFDGSDAPHGYYGSEKAMLQSTALSAGSAAREQLRMTEKDIVLVSITLNHVFGIGSAVSSALKSGAAILLPDASGVVGCGSPVQRAEATLNYLGAHNCSLLFADTHTLKALRALGSAELKSLRGGVCKVGSGTDFLDGTEKYAGATLFTMGKKA